jgi:hypothetical protein
MEQAGNHVFSRRSISRYSMTVVSALASTAALASTVPDASALNACFLLPAAE